jgi:hypothetical protein
MALDPLILCSSAQPACLLRGLFCQPQGCDYGTMVGNHVREGPVACEFYLRRDENPIKPLPAGWESDQAAGVGQVRPQVQLLEEIRERRFLVAEVERAKLSGFIRQLTPDVVLRDTGAWLQFLRRRSIRARGMAGQWLTRRSISGKALNTTGTACSLSSARLCRRGDWGRAG